MAAPRFVAASTGNTDATGAWTATCHAPGAAGRIIILQFLQDGTTTGANVPTISSTTNIVNLDGTAGTWTRITPADGENVGSAKSGAQHLYICRSASTSAPVVTGANVGGDDVYWRFYEFDDVSTGTTLATVIENSAAGATFNGAATSTLCQDTIVTTLGPDRLACNFGALSDDAMGIAVFAGATGGTWGSFQSFETATGTDGTIFAEFAGMSSDIDYTTAAAGSTNEVFGDTGTFEAQAQSFTVPNSRSLTNVRLYCQKVGSPTDNITLEIRTTSQTGTLLDSVTVNAATFPAASNYVDFTFASPISVSSGTTYFIVVSRSGARDITNYIITWGTSASVYANGTHSHRASGTWANDTNDLNFALSFSAYSGGSIDGGSDTITSIGWGVIGFALIGTTSDAPPAFQPRFEAINHTGTAVLAKARQAWHRRRSGIFVPDLWLPEGVAV